MRVIGAPTVEKTSDLQAFIELAKDPKGFEAKLKQLDAATASSEAAAAKESKAAETARIAEGRAEAAKVEAAALMAGVRKAEAALDAEKDALGIAKRISDQATIAWSQMQETQEAALDEREKAAGRREIANRAREEKLSKDEAETAKVKAEYESKLAVLRKAVA